MTAHAAAAREHAVVIGLEVHVQLETDTKIFCGCGTNFEDDEPNSHTCPTCLGLPGALPVLNEAAVEAGLKLATAIDADVPDETRFHRKNYYYPDLPKNFQITQYDSPLCENGALTVAIEDDEREIAIERAHLEEDPGSLQHAGGSGGIDTAEYTRVDYNRAGVPLMEIVTEPDFRGPEEVRAFLAKLTEVLEYLDVFDSSRDGSLRVDANISLVPGEDIEADGTIETEALTAANRTEVKNISSHKGAEKALAYEVTRQRNALQRDRTIEQETRHWDESRGVTVSMRSKEEEKDYRYFAEPDLPVLQVADRAEAVEIPELPDARRERFREEYGLSQAAARKLTSTRAVADFYERVADRFDPDVAASWVADTLLGELNYRDMRIGDVEDRFDGFVRLVELAETGEITEKNAEEVVLRAMLDEDLGPDDVIEREGLGATGEDEIERAVATAIDENPGAVEDYHTGEDGALNFLVGQVMGATGGSADPGTVNQLLRDELDG
ncbi:Asp-tRNA(Asn)/Glu-tRNA(Gln) amidotransferase subunit GatB [Halococcus saccharolyticus]|uniref:Aspartyl/glutamyl-tRNA(Asn/Gln) amidotransferase subunit B n=1 Tax=Halococcus saccharolyticus DSM 5350 TaxID=1227455 RepID=M0MQJ1_9EURY|nr:Asp-tRNA(Asn)/Glu-tRNA(Gln) amidotransferase subunit GatB [Halococcus saccharolyticus]EMA46750.1 aspartyl/glutamyl-tRNA amidotransferase subunit B [Halococcus saccharolyticus DSM 5350]